uniref:Ribose-phosphate pyrophosphokinase N-terminal domain-containing protein n=1 Tax=Panagrolaimus sp. ES5 TaxID=591445 RepID=A0AC34GTA2_9BILA
MESKFVIIAGNSHPKFVQSVVSALNVPLGRINAYKQSNNEISVNVEESVRGRDVYVIQSVNIQGSVNSDVIEALMLNYACFTAAAKSITLILPYLPYCTQSRMHGRSGVPLNLLAAIVKSSGVCRVVSIDLYRKELQGFFQLPVENLRASPFLIRAIQENIADYQNSILIAANTNALARATAFGERLKLEIGRISGTVDGDDHVEDLRMSPPPPQDRMSSFHLFPGQIPTEPPKHKQPLCVEGDVNGRIAIIVDDILDNVKLHVEAARLIKQRGAYKIYIVATHGILSGNAPALIEDSPIDEVYVTNTVPHEIQKMRTHKIKTIDISPLIVEAIRRINNNESMGALFAQVHIGE